MTITTNSTPEQRAKFEAYVARQHPTIKPVWDDKEGCYIGNWSQDTWSAWLEATNEAAREHQPAAPSELHTFLLNRISKYSANGSELDKLVLAHNDVWVLRQLIADSAAREQQLTDALQACMDFAAMRRRELGSLSPEMEAVDAKARAVLAGCPHPAGTLAHDVWMRGYTYKQFSGHDGSAAQGWHRAGVAARSQKEKQDAKIGSAA